MALNLTLGGISAPNRERLARLHRDLSAPFSVADAARALEMELPRARRFLAHLAARGWLARVRRDLYVTVPLDAVVPSAWRADPWVVAATTFAPGYIGGWSACEHWGLTEQIFRDVVVVTAHPARDRRPLIQETRFVVKGTAADRLFGTAVVWRGPVPIQVSDPARTLVDVLDDPGLGGGIRHVADVLTAYLESDHRDDDLVLGYARRLGNRTVFKRLGYLIEALGLPAPDLAAACLVERSRGYTLLDPALPARGPLLRRWNLRLNARLDRSEAA
jgi:predicted transcriptional regulator of viral defense system